MITIINISDTKFSYNGINYFKNFTPFVTGNKVSIVNTYDACISLTNFPTIYSDISVDGVIYGSVAALQNALLPVLFNRTFTQAGSLAIGFIPKSTGSNSLGNSIIYQNGNYIGINSTTATTPLHVKGNESSNWTALFEHGEALGHKIYTAYSNGSLRYGIFIADGGNDSNSNDLIIGANKFLVRGDGYVSVGTSGPMTKFHVEATNTATDSVGNVFICASNTLAANIGGQLTLGGFYNGASKYAFGGIAARKENSTSNNVAGYLAFLVTTSGGALTERMRINSSGQIEVKGVSTAANAQALIANSDTDFNIYASNSSGVSKNINFLYNGGSGQAMRIASDGKIGINTISPDNGMLTIYKATSRATESSYGIAIQSNVNNAYTELLLGADDAVDCGIIQTAAKNINFTNKKLALQPQGGSVGIATTSPESGWKLDVAGIVTMGGDAGNGRLYISTANTTNGVTYIQARNLSVATPLSYIASSHAFDTNVSIAGASGVGRLQVWGSGTTSAAYSATFYNSNGFSLFSVRNDGVLNFGTYTNSPYNVTTGAGPNAFLNSNGEMYRSTSSIKYKKNVQNYEKGLNEIIQMRPVTYNSKNESEDGVLYAGLIAEEIEDLGMHEFVQYATDGTPDALNYANMVSLLIKGIQELKAEIEILKN
jgi:Chaperone of endosialidase